MVGVVFRPSKHAFASSTASREFNKNVIPPYMGGQKANHYHAQMAGTLVAVASTPTSQHPVSIQPLYVRHSV